MEQQIINRYHDVFLSKLGNNVKWEFCIKANLHVSRELY